MDSNLIDKFISEHNSLKKLLGKIKSEAVINSPDFTFIFGSLKKFKKNLKEHVDLENDSLYSPLLEKYKGKPSEIEYIEKFISDMDELAKEIYDFIDKYTYKQKIEKRFDEFKKELDFVISSLQIRVTSEEKGVFLL